VLDTRQELRDETPFTSPTGVAGYYEYIFQPVLAADGNVESVAGSTRDISARKKMEGELRDAKSRLEAALCASVVDVTERKRAEEGFRKLAETLEAQVQTRTQELQARNAEILQSRSSFVICRTGCRSVRTRNGGGLPGSSTTAPARSSSCRG
jgi:hypothetical protein